MELPFHQEQLNFMIELTRHRVEFLDPFFRFLNYFDTNYFFFFLIPFIWIGFSYRWGLRLFYFLTLSTILNALMKQSIGWPRPSTDLYEIGMFHPQTMGFPSGAAQTSLILGGLLIYYWKNRTAAWSLGLAYILLISFSRLYLGVHYPIDLLGGWTIGLALLCLFIRTIDRIEKYLAAKGLVFCLCVAEAIPLLLLFLLPLPKISYMMGSVMGIGFGAYLSFKYGLYLKAPRKTGNGIARGLIAAAALFLLYFLTPHLFPPFAKSFLIALWISLVASPVLKRLD